MFNLFQAKNGDDRADAGKIWQARVIYNQQPYVKTCKDRAGAIAHAVDLAMVQWAYDNQAALIAMGESHSDLDFFKQRHVFANSAETRTVIDHAGKPSGPSWPVEKSETASELATAVSA